MTFIEELGTSLSVREHQIWTGEAGLSEPDRLKYVALWMKRGGKPPLPKAAAKERLLVLADDPLDCPHRGKPTGQTVGCRTCRNEPDLAVMSCGIHGICTVRNYGKKVDGVLPKCCKTCDDRPLPHKGGKSLNEIIADRAATPNRLVPGPTRLIRVRLLGHFNASLIEHNGVRLMASRLNKSRFAEVHLSELDSEYQPIRTRQLVFDHPHAVHGAEDPRFYTHNGRLHVRISGVDLSVPSARVSILDALLTEDYRVEKTWEPKYVKRRPWEKNWMPFEHDGVLYSLYNVGPPYVVLRHVGEDAVPYAHHPWRHSFTGGLIRGGAAPVRVGNEFWHFFHGMRTDPTGNDYTLGLHTFDARPPFRPLRMVPVPLLYDKSKPPRPRNENPAIYPCGAVLNDGVWSISYGLHNSSVEIVQYDHASLERLLKPV